MTMVGRQDLLRIQRIIFAPFFMPWSTSPTCPRRAHGGTGDCSGKDVSADKSVFFYV